MTQLAEIESPATSYSPGQWAALTLVGDGQPRPNGQYQGGELRSALKRKTGITHAELDELLVSGLVVQRGFSFRKDIDPDDAWGIEITPRGSEVIEFALMHQQLCSIATAQPQSEQAGWMIAMARDGLRWGSDR